MSDIMKKEKTLKSLKGREINQSKEMNKNEDCPRGLARSRRDFLHVFICHLCIRVFIILCERDKYIRRRRVCVATFACLSEGDEAVFGALANS